MLFILLSKSFESVSERISHTYVVHHDRCHRASSLAPLHWVEIFLEPAPDPISPKLESSYAPPLFARLARSHSLLSTACLAYSVTSSSSARSRSITLSLLTVLRRSEARHAPVERAAPCSGTRSRYMPKRRRLL